MRSKKPLLLALALTLVACATPEPAPAPPPLVVASDLENPPFASLDDRGEPAGRDVEMMQALAQQLGREIQWVRMSFDHLLAAAAVGEVDIVCATIGITPERAEHVAFSRPYFRTAIAVVVRTGDREPRSFAELDGRRVAAGLGTTSARAVRRRLPLAIAAREAENERPVAERLIFGEVDAAVLDGPAADAMIARHPGQLRRLSEDLDTEHYALALPPDRTELLAKIDAALAHLEQSGRMRALDERHGVAQGQR